MSELQTGVRKTAQETGPHPEPVEDFTANKLPKFGANLRSPACGTHAAKNNMTDCRNYVLCAPPLTSRRLSGSTFKRHSGLVSTLDPMRAPLTWCDLSLWFKRALGIVPIGPLDGFPFHLIFEFPWSQSVDELFLE